MQLMVVGAGGFIGARVMARAAERSMPAVGVVRSTTDRWRLTDGLAVETVSVDRPDELRELCRRLRPTHVLNATGVSLHRRTGREIEGAASAVDGAHLVLEALDGLDSKMIHLCSAMIYAPSKRPHREDDVLGPVTLRGSDKLAALRLVDEWRDRTGAPVVVVRPFSVYGPGEPEGRIIPTLIRSLDGGQEVRLTRAEIRRDFVHVDDVADGVLDAAVCSDAENEAINLASGVEISNRELARLASDVCGRPLRLSDEVFESRPADREHWCGDVTKARRTIRWAPRSLADGLADLWQSRH